MHVLYCLHHCLGVRPLCLDDNQNLGTFLRRYTTEKISLASHPRHLPSTGQMATAATGLCWRMKCGKTERASIVPFHS